MVASLKNNRLIGIQVLRGVAAIAVVLHHITLEWERVLGHSIAELAKVFLHGGQAGVDLFFVISGFVIAYSFALRPISAVRFLMQRALRVIPLYWICTAASLFVVLVIAGARRNSEFTFSYVLGSFLFLPVARPSDGVMQPVFGLGWTLNYEVFFYVFFFVAICLVSARNVLKAVVASIFLVFLVSCFLRFDAAALRFWSDSIVLEFLFGVFIAMAKIRGFRLTPGAAVFCIILAITFWLFGSLSELDRVLKWGLPAWMLTSAVTLSNFQVREGLISRFFSYLGDTSYSLYLVHMFVIRALSILALKMFHGANLDSVLVFVAYFLAALGGGVLSYKFIERPLTEFLRMRMRAR